MDVSAAAELVDAIGDQAERDRASFEAGFRLAARMFFDQGHQVGYERAHREIEERQAEVNRELIERVKVMDARRPGGRIYLFNLRAHGGQEYLGGPVPVW
ncbi:MAG: hypothetical protein JWO67_986 [Streptosporangiaceae bacterium]|nr:hypothetical protein [Streptosporangiaceae bacterium]